MSETKWSNTTTAAPLCRHMLDDNLPPEGADPTDNAYPLGAVGFATMIRAAYAKLYEPGAECQHTKNPGVGDG